MLRVWRAVSPPFAGKREGGAVRLANHASLTLACKARGDV
jgi:hypothetical protein